jgi:hypothetical protein
MPATQGQGNFDAQRFAALWAGFDTSNSNEAEAMGKARALRRMAVAFNLRLIDLLGRLDVTQALDAQMAPSREATPELMAAREMAMEHCTLAKEAMAQAEHWAAVAKQQETVIDELRRQGTPTHRPSMSQMGQVSGPAGDYASGVFAFCCVMGAAALIFVAMSHIAAALLGG